MLQTRVQSRALTARWSRPVTPVRLRSARAACAVAALPRPKRRNSSSPALNPFANSMAVPVRLSPESCRPLHHDTQRDYDVKGRASYAKLDEMKRAYSTLLCSVAKTRRARASSRRPNALLARYFSSQKATKSKSQVCSTRTRIALYCTILYNPWNRDFSPS